MKAMEDVIVRRINFKWKSYLNHLLNLLLFCGNVPSSLMVNGDNVLSLYSTISSVLNKSLIFSNSVNASNKRTLSLSESENLKFNLDADVTLANRTYHKTNFFIESNNYSSSSSTLSEKLFNLIKSKIRLNLSNTNCASVSHESSYKRMHLNRVSRASPRRKKLKNGREPLSNSTNHARKVSLLGLFELTSRAGLRAEGKSELAAAELAVKHINERGLLKGYTLELMTNDTQVTMLH
jgi:hypothetical protein